MWSGDQTRKFLEYVLGDSAGKYNILVDKGVITGEVLLCTNASDLIEYYAFAEEDANSIKGTSGNRG